MAIMYCIAANNLLQQDAAYSEDHTTSDITTTYRTVGITRSETGRDDHDVTIHVRRPADATIAVSQLSLTAAYKRETSINRNDRRARNTSDHPRRLINKPVGRCPGAAAELYGYERPQECIYASINCSSQIDSMACFNATLTWLRSNTCTLATGTPVSPAKSARLSTSARYRFETLAMGYTNKYECTIDEELTDAAA